jgi:CRISPR-associated endonuclease/helicase Cas3
MRGRPTAAWGKLRQADDGTVEAWHPLEGHCVDVAAVCEGLLRDDVVRGRLARLAGVGDLDEVDVARLCFLAAIHDAGKANHGFQRKAEPGARDVEGHVGPLFEAIFSDETGLASAIRRALRCDLVNAWNAEHLLYAALAHHGRPVRPDGAGRSARPALWGASGGRDPVAIVGGLVERALAWFPAAIASTRAFPDSPELSHAFAGLVTWADWIASDDGLFPFAEVGDGDRLARARQWAARALTATGIDGSAARASLSSPLDFASAFRVSTPRPAQQAIIDLAPQPRGSLVVLEAETGSGKTEAALAHYLALFRRGEVDGLYFALPTRTAATQLHDRVRVAVERVFAEEVRPPVILAVPGYLKVDDAVGVPGAPRLSPFRTLWPDHQSDRFRWRGWAAESSKRYLAGAVAVGTVDQVLLSGLAVKHAHLRATALLRQLLVVDEVHASDAYMNRLLEVVLDRHLRSGGHALLMSATLGGATRGRFLSGRTGRRQPPSLRECEAAPYPAVTLVDADRSGSQVPRVVAPDSSGQPIKRVAVELAPLAGDHEAVARIAAEAGQSGARVIVLRNKVADAVTTQVALERALGRDSDVLFRCGGRPAPHHSRFTREDRLRLDRELEAAFGRDRKGPGRVVVATQTIQQSLDLDADLLISDLCPMDVLLQRIGRLHRHVQPPNRPRPAAFAAPKAIIVVPPSELGNFIGPKGTARGPLGLGSVYEDLRIIEATWRELLAHPVLEIPAMNRGLVERTTHPEALRAVAAEPQGPAELKGRWLTHQQECEGKGSAKAGAAGLVLFDWSEPYGERGFDPAVEAAAATRLGASDRNAVFVSPFVTPFGESSRDVAIPHWLARGVPEDTEPEAAVVDVSVGRVQFRFGPMTFVYDRLGLRRAEEREAASEEEAGNG